MLENYEEALREVKDGVRELLENLLEANIAVYEGLSTCNQEKFENAKTSLKNTTAKTSAIDNKIIKLLALFAPEATDLREAVAFLKITNEILRATVNTRGLIKGLKKSCDSVDTLNIKEFAIPLQNSTVKSIELVKDMLDIDCIDELRDIFNDILIEENKADDFYELLEKSIFDNLLNLNDFEMIHKILRAFRKSEKITDRSISMASLLLYIRVGGVMQRI